MSFILHGLILCIFLVIVTQDLVSDLENGS